MVLDIVLIRFSLVLVLGLWTSAYTFGRDFDRGRVRVPFLGELGRLPFYMEGYNSDDQEQKALFESMEGAFKAAVEESKRFHILSDAIVEEFWDSPEGRRELKEDYELSAYVHLGFFQDEDTVRWVAKLLDPDFKNLLYESAVISKRQFLALAVSERNLRIKELIFRVFNLLPIDLSISSIQDRYITLSAGSEEELREGDQLDLFRSFIKEVHPLTGAWVKFENRPLGRARVIDVKMHSAVAVIEDLSYANALEIGDGAKIKAIRNRRFFSASAAQHPLKLEDHAPVILLAEAGSSPSLPPSPAAQTPLPSPRPEPIIPSPTPSMTPSTAENAEVQPGEALPLSLVLKDYIDGYEVHLGLNLWSASGAAKAESVVPFWIINNLNLDAWKALGQNFLASGKIGGSLGDTKKGSYLGFEMGGAFYYRLGLEPWPGELRFGVFGLYDSYGVEKETYGGINLLSVGPSIEALGSFNIAEVGALDAKAALDLMIFGSGSAGLKGKTREIGSLSGFRFRLDAHKSLGNMALGPYLTYQSADFSFQTGSLVETQLELGLKIQKSL